MKSRDNSRVKKSKTRKKTRSGLLARAFGALICRTRRSSSLSTSSQSSNGKADKKRTMLSRNKGISSSSSSSSPPQSKENDDIRLTGDRSEKSTQTLDPNEAATNARYYDQNVVGVDACNINPGIDVDYSNVSAMNRQRAFATRVAPRNELLCGGEIGGGNANVTPSSSTSMSSSSTSTTPLQDRDISSFFDGDPRERDYIVQYTRNQRDPSDFRRMIDVKTKEKDNLLDSSGALGTAIDGSRYERAIDTIGLGRECYSTKSPANITEPPAWYCERMAGKMGVPRRQSTASAACSSTDNDSVRRSYESVVEPIVHQVTRTRSGLRLLPTQLTPEEKKRLMKIVAVIVATAGVAALIMLLLKYKRASGKRRRGVVCSDLCSDEDLVTTSTSSVGKPAGARVGSCDDDNDEFDDEGTCVYEKYDRVKCSNSNFKGLVCKSEKLRESDNTVCASHDFRKVTKRLKEPKSSKPNSFTRLEKDRICDAKKCFETL